MGNDKLYRTAMAFEKISKELYAPPFREIAKKFNFIFKRLKESQSEHEEALVDEVGPVKEINPSHFQFQATVFRDPEAEMNGDKFPGFSKLADYLSNYLGKPKEKSKHQAAWETVEVGKEPIRISIVAYDAGQSSTHSIKVTIGPLRAGYL